MHRIIIFLLLFVLASCEGENSSNTEEDLGNNFPNEYYSMNWSDLSSDRMVWDNAKIYCEALGGRLPTISELRILLKRCEGTIKGGACGIKDQCLSTKECWNDSFYGCQCNEYDPGKYSVFDEGYYLWSSSEQSDNNDEVWTINFYFAYVFSSYKFNTCYVRCVQN